MPKSPVSVTLSDDNLSWLRGRTVALKARSLSETIDTLVTRARQGGETAPAAIRSVAGTIDIAADDPELADADRLVRQLVDGSLARPVSRRRRPGRAAMGRRRG
jgi:hypothetical protein